MWSVYTEKFPHDFMVSNLGNLDFPSQFGQLQLEAVYGPALVSPIKENYGVITVATVGGRMFFTLTYSG